MFYHQAEQIIAESKQPPPVTSSSSSPIHNWKWSYFQDNPAHMASLKICRPSANHSPMNLCMSYFSEGTHIAGKWDTPAQLERGRQGWLLTFQWVCTGRGRSARKGGFTLVQGLHENGQKPVTGFNKQAVYCGKSRGTTVSLSIMRAALRQGETTSNKQH